MVDGGWMSTKVFHEEIFGTLQITYIHCNMFQSHIITDLMKRLPWQLCGSRDRT